EEQEPKDDDKQQEEEQEPKDDDKQQEEEQEPKDDKEKTVGEWVEALNVMDELGFEDYSPLIDITRSSIDKAEFKEKQKQLLTQTSSSFIKDLEAIERDD
ncbi:34489_t:CDS:2, partial [Racocetra persica]